MPEGTKVDRLYHDLLAKGFNKSSSARIAQKKTGLALATGKPPQHPDKSEKKAVPDCQCKTCDNCKKRDQATIINYNMEGKE